MINLAFIYLPSNNWVGGKNYYLSLFKQLSKQDDVTLHIISSPEAELDEIPNKSNILVTRTKLLSNRRLSSRIIRYISRTVLGENAFLYFILKKLKIDLLSHSYITPWLGFRCIPWIPDFQHKYLPQHFSKKEISVRDIKYKKYLSSGSVLFSSYSAKSDAEKFYNLSAIPYVYRFSPYLESANENSSPSTIDDIPNTPYVFLPNQFWKHKNHKVVFEALKVSTLRGRPFKLICTGELSDYRNPHYIQEISNLVEHPDIREHISLLGLVDRQMYIKLLRGAALVVNPSFFEGWSSTVEESKYLNKKLVLSDIPVHLEQIENYENALCFKAGDHESCLSAIYQSLEQSVVTNSYTSEEYYQIVKEILGK